MDDKEDVVETFKHLFKRKKKEKSYNKWLNTFTKIAVATILFFSILDM